MDDLTLICLAVGFLLVCSAFFSASETALTAVSRPYIHQLEQDGSRRAVLIARLLEKPDRLIGALLLGNNLVAFLASSLATGVVVAYFGDLGIALTTVALTALFVLFGDVIPKTYALYFTNPVALAVARPVTGLVFVLTPVVYLIEKTVNGVLRLFRVQSRGTSLETAMMELRGAIEVHAAEEEVQQERKMLHSVLDLRDMIVPDIMVHRVEVETLDADMTPDEILDQVLDSPYSRLPVWKDTPDNIIGLVHVRDIIRVWRKSGGKVPALDLTGFLQTPQFIPTTTRLREQFQAFRDRKETFAVVVDEYGSFAGIITQEDILKEIMGDYTGIYPQKDGSLVVQGSVTVRDLNREFEWVLPDDLAPTIAGLLLHEIRRIPDAGQRFTFWGFGFEILKRERNQITRIRITPPVADDGVNGSEEG